MERRIIAVCATWEDEENLNLFLSHLIRDTDEQAYLPVCITFDRKIVRGRGMKGLQEFMALFDLERLAGVVLFGEMIRSDTISTQLIEMGRQKQIPVFMLERTYENCINMRLSFGSGFEQVARHMVEVHGCRDIVMVAGDKGNVYSEERIAVLRSVLSEKGCTLPDERIIHGNYWDVPTISALNRYFGEGGEMPKAFICANDAMAIAVCDYLEEHGFSVPKDVLVSGFDGIVFGGLHVPSITTAEPDFHTMVSGMIRRIEEWNPASAGTTEDVPIPYMPSIRQSCGCKVRSHSHLTETLARINRENLDYSRHIREMGHLVRNTLSMDTVDNLVEALPAVFAVWPDPYYCLVKLDETDRNVAETILHGANGQYTSGTLFSWRRRPVPDYDELLSDRSVCIVLAHLLQTSEETMGYIICGEKSWSLRDEQRFEERAVFMSSVLSAVLNNRRLKAANEAIRELAVQDFLTGLYNRRGFIEELNTLLDRPEVQDKQIWLFSVDLDGLKKINDVFGHAAGDTAIKCIAKALEMETRDNGIAARYGGDEFAFAILETNAEPPVECIRERIEANARQADSEKKFLISASIGACSYPVRTRPSLEEMMLETDRKLYDDKVRRKAMRM